MHKKQAIIIQKNGNLKVYNSQRRLEILVSLKIAI